MKIFFLLLLSLSIPLHAKKKLDPRQERELRPIENPQSSLKPLLSSLDRYSISQHLAFYDLYPETGEGKQALKRAWELIGGDVNAFDTTIASLPPFDLQAVISLVTRASTDTPVKLTPDQLQLIDAISRNLGNRSLKGQRVWTKEAVLELTPEEVDVSRALLIFQFDEMENPKQEILQYEASIDMMALQIAARLGNQATNEDKIREINRFIFQEMQFRFPPPSLSVTDIDLYTFLPSVIDSRQGVCLGVSILYLALAQRLNLPMEIITPPGHIYVRYPQGDSVINIETTARGIDLPSEVYLGINTRKLQLRNMKEVVGLAFMNQAAVFWSRQDYSTTSHLYETARLFLPNDPLLKMFMGFNYLFIGKHSEGTKLLREIRHITFDESVSPETIPDDYLSGKIDAEGIKAVYLPVDETRESILLKLKELKQIIKSRPNVILCGDFNIFRGRKEIESLARDCNLQIVNSPSE
ncbi:MAG: transglutaminase family protein, partial [Chlamydiota bacterium]